jgi:hypothetical protein
MNSLPARENRHRRGAALLLVMFIALGAILAMVALFAVMSSRQFSVKGGAVSDRALAMSDAGVDRIVEMINTTGMSFSSPVVTANGSTPPTTTATQQVIAQLLAGINGGTYDSSQSDGGLSTISANVRRYFYNVSSNSYYRLESGTLASGILTDLSTGATVTDTPTTGLAGDLSYQTDNLWFEMDANATYHYDQTNPDTWVLKVTAFDLATPTIQRTVKAEIGRGDVSVNTGTTTSTTQTANGNWYIRNTTTTTTTHWFSDFSGMYHTKTSFGKYEVTQGMIRSDSDLYMGGWAKDPVYAAGHVYDTAIDDGNKSDGAFGVSLTDSTKPAGNLSWAKTNGYATDGYATANFNNGTKFLTGTSPARNTVDPSGGMQDLAATDYYVGLTPANKNGDATIVFSVQNGVGMVTITPSGGSSRTFPMPPNNGVIYVEGTATVSGIVLGRASVGAGDDIDIGGNILYNTLPRTNRTDAQPSGPPDSLGLVAMNNIVIPTSTYLNNRTLEIDSAMMAVNGWFGIDPNAPTHDIDVTPHYVGIWNGAQAVWSSANAPAVSTGGSNERGYEEQHTNFDYNLLEYGPPPMYPPSDTTTSPVSVTTYDLVSDSTLLRVLRAQDKSTLTPIDPSDKPVYDPNNACYYLDYNGHRYYYGPSFNVTSVTQSTAQAVYSGQALPLYRVSWKEQIAQPVVP